MPEWNRTEIVDWKAAARSIVAQNQTINGKNNKNELMMMMMMMIKSLRFPQCQQKGPLPPHFPPQPQTANFLVNPTMTKHYAHACVSPTGP
jgi:predicted small lipoprotein YifL